MYIPIAEPITLTTAIMAGGGIRIGAIGDGPVTIIGDTVVIRIGVMVSAEATAIADLGGAASQVAVTSADLLDAAEVALEATGAAAGGS